MDNILPERESRDLPAERVESNQASSTSPFAVGQRPEIPTNVDKSGGIIPPGGADSNGISFGPQQSFGFSPSPNFEIGPSGEKLSRSNDSNENSRDSKKQSDKTYTDSELDELKPYPKGFERSKK